MTPTILPHMVRWRCEVDQRLSSLKGKRGEHTKPRSLIQDRRFSKQLGHFCCYLLLYLCGTEILMTAEINSGQARESKQLLSQSLNVSMRSHVIKDNQHSPPSPPLLLYIYFFCLCSYSLFTILSC